ncbi:TetR/AcrR family transcriptional regulator [Oceanobacillus halotolerans]|uniref:TetR/AcrR family transcriptional regulator n=1 Tax=Oceanobacillus halotolerans TaxID=2663380 RepID=UPI0013D9D653|nr:TetR-like C-terminal domain-containing protein [Oceanobacillus halotolerans]
MDQKIDRRIRKTRSALKNAYIELMEQYSEKEITVSMITQFADLNRATFYAHYSNKTEFLEEILYDALEGLKEAIIGPFVQKAKIQTDTLTPTTERIFAYIEQNKKIFHALYVGHNDFKANLEALFYDIFSKDIFIETESTFGEVNYDMFLHYQTNATLGLLLYWIKSKFKYPATYMMKQLTILSNTKINNLRRM